MQKVITKRECPICDGMMEMIKNNLYVCTKCGCEMSTNGHKEHSETKKDSEE